MTVDSGFAPNYDFGVLTLATCKPYIREVAKVGEWIAGFSSKTLDGSEIGKEKLIYLAKITKRLTFAEYWESYPQKRPDATNTQGDNIYEPSADEPQGFKVFPNKNHPSNGEAGSDCSHNNAGCQSHDDDKTHDLKSLFVLVCEEFYYFGPKNALSIPENIRPNLPERQTCYGEITEAEDVQNFIDYVKANKEKCKVYNKG
ncbi:hypothetical protein CQA49_03270 [Helicobacter sp. MIT 00-7814]|nr:hypothetical protein CQA37_03690 [Helicobacter sp. MIT 99-10781]RDU55586.1 hypothetical protein CQA49_03270 [Helicobacter sp. MIT 00-7814]